MLDGFIHSYFILIVVMNTINVWKTPSYFNYKKPIKTFNYHFKLHIGFKTDVILCRWFNNWGGTFGPLDIITDAWALNNSDHQFKSDLRSLEEGLQVQLVGPFRVEDGLKIRPLTCCHFLEVTFFRQWLEKKSGTFKKTIIFMLGNAEFHTAKCFSAWITSTSFRDDYVTTCSPSSPELNSFQSLQAILKTWDL